nr:hypothetical protein [uncultured Dyadobacter sp.]
MIAEKEFASDRLTQVRDTFLFCCYTGLAYSDIQSLERSDISRGLMVSNGFLPNVLKRM